MLRLSTVSEPAPSGIKAIARMLHFKKESKELKMNHELLEEHTDITTYLRNSVMFDALIKVLFKPRHRALVGYITREQYRSKKEKNTNEENDICDDH
jgi:hypothetical protein